jgi:hypothetical protein
MRTVNNNTAARKPQASWWPRLIIAAFVGFMLFIGNMVRQAMQTEVDLVSKDYYQQEIAYQKHIDQLEATGKLASQAAIIHAAAARQLSLVFPAGSGPDTGQVRFFRPSNASLDFDLPLLLNRDRQQHIPTSQLAKGLWRVQLSWQQNGQHYFQEKMITL